jgi:hypothetical protein
LLTECQSAFGKPAYSHRVDQVFLDMHSLRKCLRRVVQLYRYYCLYDQWSTIEFLGDEVHGAAVLRIAGLERALMSV